MQPERSDDREDQQRHDHDAGHPALGDMDNLIPGKGDADGEHGEQDHGLTLFTTEQGVDRLRGHRLVERVVADIGDERDTPDEERADIPELRPRLDHLRQAELWPLRRVEGHEKRAERAAEHDGDGHPQERAAEGCTDHAGCHGREVGLAGEPDRPEVPYPAVPLRKGDVIDAALFE